MDTLYYQNKLLQNTRFSALQAAERQSYGSSLKYAQLLKIREANRAIDLLSFDLDSESTSIIVDDNQPLPDHLQISTHRKLDIIREQTKDAYEAFVNDLTFIGESLELETDYIEEKLTMFNNSLRRRELLCTCVRPCALHLLELFLVDIPEHLRPPLTEFKVNLDQVLARITDFESISSSLSPIRRLSDEVLLNILQRDRNDPFDTSCGLLKAGQVSRGWRQLTMNKASLWTHPTINIRPTMPTGSLALLLRFLNLSQTLPLTIHYTAPAGVCSLVFFAVLTMFARRWETVILHAPLSCLASFAVSALSMPILKRIFICSIDEKLMPALSVNMLSNAPNLHDIELVNVCLSMQSRIRWKFLTLLSLTDTGIDRTDQLGILQLVPNLMVLEVCESDPDHEEPVFPSWQYRNVSHDSLKNLCLRDARILENLDLPFLQSLQIDCPNSDPMDPRIFENVLVQRLTSLTLQNVILTLGLIAFLRETPTLEELQIVNVQWWDEHCAVFLGQLVLLVLGELEGGEPLDLAEISVTFLDPRQDEDEPGNGGTDDSPVLAVDFWTNVEIGATLGAGRCTKTSTSPFELGLELQIAGTESNEE
ncbi:hypothetical protein C8J56DRAFT_1048490 [Mycena floridula]|nr:hypothetical protein C8J56DRAFT_1048490 [Mycena floridula]